MPKKMTGFERTIAKMQFGYQARMEFYKQVAALLRAGMSKTDAIQMTWTIASKEGKKPKEGTAMILADVINSMKAGKTFGSAIKPWVPADDTMILEAIENTPDFAGNLDEYVILSGKKKKIKSSITGGLAYPISLLAAVYGMMLYFGSSVIPTIADILPKDQWTGAGKFLAFMGDFAEFYADNVLIGAVVIIGTIVFSLPRWAGKGRKFADKFPIYSTYRMYTGISFLMSMAALMKGGTSTMDALNRIRPNSNRYVLYRLDLVAKKMLNGDNFGAALHKAGTGWPDSKMNLSIKIFAETQDLSKQLSILAREWVDKAQETITASMALLGTFALMMVFGVVLGLVGGIYGVQEQMTQAMQNGG